MSTAALPKLEGLIADLDKQEQEVSSQLEAVRAKLEAVRAVLPLFDETAEAAQTSTAPTTKSTATKSTATKSTATKSTATKSTATKSTATKSTPRTSSKASATSSTTKAAKQSSKGTSKKKKDGRAASWQKYTRPGVKNQSIPDAVKLILSTQPEKEFKIAEVMAALFKDSMPKAQYLKARNRVSNVLSGGVRAGDWHRGGRSTYRMSAG